MAPNQGLHQGPAIINWLSNNCNLIGFNDCFDASANYQLLFLGICQLSIIDIMIANNWQYWQSELDRRHQSAFLKKRFCIHHVPPARAADKKIQPT